MNKAIINILEVTAPSAQAFGAVRLAKGQAASLTPRSGTRLVCAEGSLWLTREGDPADYILKAGESFELDAPLVVSGLGSASYLVA